MRNRKPCLHTSKEGYLVTGIDLSPDMVGFAEGKPSRARDRPYFFVMDMRKFDLGQKFEAILSMFGGFGYMHAESEVSGFMFL